MQPGWAVGQHAVLCCVQATVLEVKEMLVDLTNIPTDRQRLIFRGAVLQDTQGLASAREHPGSPSSSLLHSALLPPHPLQVAGNVSSLLLKKAAGFG
jgi:hypothetical protein